MQRLSAISLPSDRPARVQKPFAPRWPDLKDAPVTAPSEESPNRSRSWPVPTTFGGVAALGFGRFWWLGAWQAAIAMLTAVVLVIALEATWVRSLERAVAALPERAAIVDGRLNWTNPAPAILNSSPFLGVVVDPGALRELGGGSDVTLFLESDRVALRSLFGWIQYPYPPQHQVPLGRFEVEGWLAAWKSPILGTTGLALAAALLASWTLLATAYGLPVWLLSLPAQIHPTLGQCWRLAGAAVLPGALFLTGAVALYASRQLEFVGLLLAFPAHFAVGWIYLFGGLRRLKRDAAPVRANPFSTTPPPAPSVPARRAPENPFQPPPDD